MPGSLRVLLAPLRHERAGDARLLLDGAVLRLARHGRGTSQASVGSPAKAKITLEMAFLSGAREPTIAEQRKLATLNGELRFRDATTPVFSGTADENGVPQGLVLDPAARDQAPESARSRRVLRFSFASPDFENVPNRAQELIVKLDTSRFRYVEIRAKLEIAGSVEADANVNDVLDVAITSHNPPPLVEGAVIGIHPPLFDEIPRGATLVVTPSSGKALTYALDAGSNRGDGLLSFTVEDPQPGILYAAEIRFAGSGERTLLFANVELHQLIAESDGAPPAPLPPFGSDPLAFEAPAAEPPDGVAVQGGPEETSDEQLASLDAQAGTTVLV